MRKKRYFRYSNGLKSAGVSEAWQHIIYGIVTNPNKTDMQKQLIMSICRRVAGADADGLFEFLTDQYIDHNYIFSVYKIPPKKLFQYKTDFFVKMQTYIGKKI